MFTVELDCGEGVGRAGEGEEAWRQRRVNGPQSLVYLRNGLISMLFGYLCDSQHIKHLKKEPKPIKSLCRGDWPLYP